MPQEPQLGLAEKSAQAPPQQAGLPYPLRVQSLPQEPQVLTAVRLVTRLSQQP
jgi:hypothetical protein